MQIQIDEAKRLVKNMRVCCGDVPLDDDMECADFCANPCDMRNGELRFCREWLLKDAADMIEFLIAKLDETTTKGIKLEIELEQVKREKDAAVADMERLQGLICQACKEYYQPNPAIRKWSCKIYGDYWGEVTEDGLLCCGKFKWRGVQN